MPVSYMTTCIDDYRFTAEYAICWVILITGATNTWFHYLNLIKF